MGHSRLQQKSELADMSRRRFLRATSLTALSALIAQGAAQAEAAGVVPGMKFLTPESSGYDGARSLFNARLDFRPALIARCKNTDEVVAAVKAAAAKPLQVTVKSGGHSFEGFSANHGGMMVDLAGMNALNYEEDTMSLVAQPGCRLGQIVPFLLAKGRLLPAGSCAGVGIGGLTLGGGYGLFARKWGLTCDHLTGLKMVDGKGNVVESLADPELLKACRGGGNGNFGIITELRFRTVPAPERLSNLRIRYRQLTPEKVTELAREWFSATADLPHDGFSAFVLNGMSLTILVTFFEASTASYVEKAFQSLRKRAWKPGVVRSAPTSTAVTYYHGRPGPLPFKNASAGYYRDFQHIAGILPELARRVGKVSGMVWQMNTLGGAIASPEFEKQSIYPHRRYPYLGEIQGYWEDRQNGNAQMECVASIQRLFSEHGIKDHYRNYPDIGFQNYAEAYYGEGLELLRAMKQRYDPDDLIRHPQSVKI